MERRFAGLICLLLLLLAACSGQPTPLTGDVDLDQSDPNVGGGVGIVLPDETPGPLPTATHDMAPRATIAEAIVVPIATDGAPTATQPPPSPTILFVEPTARPVATAEIVATDSPPPTEAAPIETDDSPERPLIHIVAVGENLYRIGLQYGISYVTLAEYNGITNYDQISVGQELQIPPAEESPAESDATATTMATAEPTVAAPESTPTPQPAAEATVSATPSAGHTHTVLPGENLYRISQQYGINWVLIAEANGLISPNQITVGQVLKIPTDAPGPAPRITHQVRAGESLFRIALQYGVPLTAMVEANSLQPPYAIYPGQILIIPGQGE